jgi:hypothetical protein
MATETGTVELPTNETTDDTLAETQAAIFELLSKDPQKSGEQEPKEPAAPEQPPQETEPKSEAEPETPSNADTEAESEAIPPDVQASVDKRIGKEVAKRKELEEQLAERDAKLAELDAKVKELTEAPKAEEAPAPTNGTLSDNDPILQVPEIKAAWKQENKALDAFKRASALLRDLGKDPDGVFVKLKEVTGQVFTDVDAAREWLEGAKDHYQLQRNEFMASRHAATNRYQQKTEAENAKAKEKSDAEAVKAYPWIKTPASREGQVAAKVLKRWPNLMYVPDGALILGDLVAGQLAREGKVAAPAAPVAPPPKLATNGKTALPANSRVAKAPTSALREKAVESGDLRDIAKYLATAI